MKSIRKLYEATTLPKLFSSLKGKQKDDLINNIILVANGFDKMEKGLGLNILHQSGQYEDQRNKVVTLIKGQRLFNHEQNQYPFNISEIFKAIKAMIGQKV